MHIRRYKKGEEAILRELFYNTVRYINLGDYSAEQVEAWAPDTISAWECKERVEGINPYVCIVDNTIAGYSNLQEDGYIDHFFVSRNYQKIGVGKALMEYILKEAKSKNINRLYSQVSITAKPFFERYGFKVVKEQTVNLRGVFLTNYLMEKFI